MPGKLNLSAKIKFVLVAIFMVVAGKSAHAQRIAVTSNLLEDAFLTPNLGVEVVVADRQTLTFDLSYAPYKISERFHNKCMTFRTGYRYWLTQALYAHYIGVDALTSSSDRGVGNFDFRGEYVALGLSYGYSFIIGKKFNIVPGIGVGVAYGNTYRGYDQMDAPGQAVQAVETPGFMPVLTRLSVTIQYVFK